MRQLASRFRVETISTAGDFLVLHQDFPDDSYAVRGSRPRSWRRRRPLAADALREHADEHRVRGAARRA
jgi:hypothetical protein